MFRIKICGVTNVSDAITAVDAGADAIGLNFYEKSPRHVDTAVARDINAALELRAFPVGVFVNASQDAIASKVCEGFLHGVQLHGDEPPDFLAGLTAWKLARAADLAKKFEDKGRTEWAKPLRKASAEHCLPFLIRVRRFSDQGISEIHNDLVACCQAGGPPMAVLVDAATPGRYGGTGETVSWVGLADHRRWLGDTPLILAGGLTPDNVAEAIRIVRPHGVDVASGVESATGKKDPVKVRDFIAAARAAFGE